MKLENIYFIGFIVCALVVVFMGYNNHIENQQQEQQDQKNEIVSELCKSYFTRLNDTEYIILSEPEFVVRDTGEYICKVKLGKNCTGYIRKSQDKTFAINVCEQVAYAGLNTGMFEFEEPNEMK